jgi:cytochrome c oxidase subunit IV
MSLMALEHTSSAQAGPTGAEAAGARHSRRQYFMVFGGLAVLTVLELGIIRMPGIARGPAVAALLGLAITKAILIGFFFMHLKDETRVLRVTVLGPLAAPAVYALVLMADSAWRLLR